MRNGSIQWSQLLYRDISNWNARRIRPFAQGAFHHSSRCAIYRPKIQRDGPAAERGDQGRPVHHVMNFTLFPARVA
jgi:hypothetical protein